MKFVPCEYSTGRMRPDKLEDMVKMEIEKGNKPFFVNGTASTTVMGGFDDFHAIADICEKYDMWMNVDACWGGFLIFADKYKDRKLLAGVERANSLCFNPHKGLGVPI